MRCCFKFFPGLLGPFFLICLTGFSTAWPQVPVPVQTNVTIRVMAANITSGNNQRYESPGMNIFKGLKPDIVAVQEFNYVSTNGGTPNTIPALREMIDTAFGTNFVYFRESGYSIPNGIISRYPILSSGTWDDVQVPDRGFAWALVDLPGTNDLYVVSVHLHSSGGASSRAIEATNLKVRIQSDFPANAFIVVAGDLNTDSRSEQALSTFKTFLSDSPIPHDGTASADPDTNATTPRNKPYDYVLPSFNLSSNQVPTVLGSRTFNNGLVFDSRVYTPLSEVSPVQLGDSGVFQMQHMGVLKDFRISFTVTNLVTVPQPVLEMVSTSLISWQGLSGLTYTVESSVNLSNWFTAGSAFSTTTNFSFINTFPTTDTRFFRVTYP